MRRIRLLLLAAVVVLGILGPARLAGAAGEPGSEEELVHQVEEIAKENGASKYDAECVAILAEGGTVDDCHAAPNALLPELNEIIWGAIGFFVVLGFITWKGLPAMKAGMNARTERIRNDLESAESQRVESETVLSEYKAQLADARSEAGRIIDEARQTADALKRDLQAQNQADIEAAKAKNLADIEAAKVQAIADLRGEVAALAIGAAERVVERNLDQATSAQLVENFIDQVGTRS